MKPTFATFEPKVGFNLWLEVVAFPMAAGNASSQPVVEVLDGVGWDYICRSCLEVDAAS